ncbi:MAG: amino acid ABC transporter substrate-binding protein [Spirochaetes bacterium]|nr:amino acid ABC transporter substrate-binding protein [Spirochaetota bacterium]
MKLSARSIISAACILSVVVGITGSPAAGLQPGDAYRAIKAAKKIRIGVSKDYPPLNFNGGERGVEIEMANQLGDFLGVSVELVPLEVSEYAAAIEKRAVDAVIGGYSRNLARGRTVWFSEPYLSVTPGVLADARSLPKTSFGDTFEQAPFATLWDIKRLPGFRFAVKKGSAYEHILETDFPDNPRRVVASNEAALSLIDKREADGFVHDSLYLEYLYANSAGLRNAYILLGGGNRIERICVGLPFGDTVLKNQVDLFVLEIIRLGHIEKWLERYSKKK